MKNISLRKILERMRCSKKSLRRIGIACVFILLCAAGIVYWYYPQESATYQINLIEDGFAPNTITVAKGDTIIFTTTRGKPFWPASDLHPTHDIYSEFDSREPIDPDTSWSFTFDKEGEWRFHDHLSPLFRGRITVEKSNRILGKADTSSYLEKCRTLSPQQKQQCWSETLKLALQEKGLAAAFDVFAGFYSTEPDFAEECHPFTHQIGEAAYEKFSRNEDFDITSQIAYCSYGFYHGFMEAMLQKTGKLDEARALCDYIDKKLEGKGSGVGTNDACFHGIGHGVTDGSDPRAKGDVFATINPGLELCGKIGRNEREIKLCGTGVFNALAGFYLDPQYGLNKDDPFWICRQQSKSYFKHACYDDLKTLIMTLADSDFGRAITFIEDVSEDEYAKGAIDNLATFAGYSILRNDTVSQAIQACHDTEKRLRVACIQGLGAGFITAGLPDKEYIKAVELCNSPLITEEERVGCFERILWSSYARYPKEKHLAICETVGQKYRKYCEVL